MTYDERSLLKVSLSHKDFLLPLECPSVSVGPLGLLQHSSHQPEANTENGGAEGQSLLGELLNQPLHIRTSCHVRD